MLADIKSCLWIWITQGINLIWHILAGFGGCRIHIQTCDNKLNPMPCFWVREAIKSTLKYACFWFKIGVVWYFTIYPGFNYNMGINRYSNLSKHLFMQQETTLYTHLWKTSIYALQQVQDSLTCRFAHAGESLWVGISLLVVSEPVFLSLEAVVVVAVVVCTGKIGCHTFTSVPLPKAWIAFSVKINHRKISISKQMAESRTDFVTIIIIIPLKMCIYRNSIFMLQNAS